MAESVGPVRALSFVLFVGVLMLISGPCVGQDPKLDLTVEKVMTTQELKDTGVSTLTAAQRKALEAWLNRYTKLVINIATSHAESSRSSPPSQSAPPTPKSNRSLCSPAIESTISGDFEGWSGETLFKLDNGQIWEQAEYDYMYSYQYRPDVTIFETASGCRMKVGDETDTILVRRVK